jgi:hypothetical protein
MIGQAHLIGQTIRFKICASIQHLSRRLQTHRSDLLSCEHQRLRW